MESRSPEGLRILVKQKLNQGPYDSFGGRLPRSPVWLRKIPSTVSGSQGSRRGFAPAVRFAFPLGARLNTTLRARPCQELFSESFPGRPAGRGAPRLPGFGPSRRRVRHYTRPRRGGGGKPARTQDADNSSAAERRGLGRAASAGASPRIASAHVHRRNRPGGPALARLGPPGRSIRPRTFNYLYISRRIGAHLQTRDPSAFIMQAAPLLSLALPYSPSSNFSRSEYQPWLLSTAKGTPKSSVMQSPVRSSSFLPSA